MEQVPLADWQILEPGICSKISGFLVLFINLRGGLCCNLCWTARLWTMMDIRTVVSLFEIALGAGVLLFLVLIFSSMYRTLGDLLRALTCPEYYALNSIFRVRSSSRMISECLRNIWSELCNRQMSSWWMYSHRSKRPLCDWIPGSVMEGTLA